MGLSAKMKTLKAKKTNRIMPIILMSFMILRSIYDKVTGAITVQADIESSGSDTDDIVSDFRSNVCCKCCTGIEPTATDIRIKGASFKSSKGNPIFYYIGILVFYGFNSGT